MRQILQKPFILKSRLQNAKGAFHLKENLKLAGYTSYVRGHFLFNIKVPTSPFNPTDISLSLPKAVRGSVYDVMNTGRDCSTRGVAALDTPVAMATSLLGVASRRLAASRRARNVHVSP